MAKLVWDAIGEHYYETGTDHGVLYIQDTTGAYGSGEVWNGLTGVTESPSGGDPTDMWADNIKYASVRAAEKFGCTIEAYTYPDSFAECDGSREIAPGVTIGQQSRKPFGFSYRTRISNDMGIEENRLHLIYGATASPSEKSYTTVNESPDAITFSWEVDTTPVNVTGFNPTSYLSIDTRKCDKTKLKDLEDVLYGTESEEARLPLPDEVADILGTEVVSLG